MTSSKMKEYKLVEPGVYKAVRTHSNSNDDILCTSFDLYAVVHHSGALGSGHYVATVKDSNQRDGLWYCYNDDEVGVHVHYTYIELIYINLSIWLLLGWHYQGSRARCISISIFTILCSA